MTGSKSHTVSVISRRDERETLFGPLVTGRSCGECAACCVHTQIDTPELVKPLGESCVHCTGSGCGIYEQRFPVCRSWQCIWKHIEALPDEVRPDLSGLMIVLDHQVNPENIFTKVFIRIIVIDAARAESSELTSDILDMFCQGDLPVWIDDRCGELTLIHPPEKVARHLISTSGLPADVDKNIDTSSSALIEQWQSGVRIKPAITPDTDNECDPQDVTVAI